MIDALCIIGHPSRLGGADTELDHQIHCWQAMGVDVHICHTGALDANLRAMQMEQRGCIYHRQCDWSSLDGMHCISFCNGEFLKALPEIRKYARTTTFVNCMTWNFDRELEMQSRGLIDFHLYQTDHAMERVSQKLKDRGTYRPLRFQPHFHAADFPFHEQRPTDKFRFGRISRDDADKHGARQLWIYETMTAPVLKEGVILGWGQRAQSKYGREPDSYIRTHPEGGISQKEFYEFCEAIIMTTETFENLPRVGFEAMASGSVLVVDNRGGWTLEVEDGKTGWLCRDDREFVYKASRCAFEQEERNRMRHAARQRLDEHWGLETAMKSWERVFDAWEAL
ncbi:MAG: glycosyltransferase family 1 protein [Planctomycetota bacterium]|nr:MAG: glycosyltransferase family 1 protein [Planctomycetota bacterium]REJ95974.1 MAG: glycosyltransferase family 1 protein [Planctomycetota bacterium]REK21529.1 MAG: glycosyltransferase family 1 protein [Planctomycetota bacterium]REK39916.1 MAG: glycosyltransferase family 1 protein [Planctomycetota bacterium]